MQRSEINNIFPEASQEQLEAIMALHGASTTELRRQLETAQKDLETLRAAPDHTEALATADLTIQGLRTELDGLKNAERLRQLRERVAAEKKIPVNLLTAETEEACAAQADAILAFADPGYPAVKDGGEAGGGTPSTREQFASWAQDNNL